MWVLKTLGGPWVLPVNRPPPALSPHTSADFFFPLVSCDLIPSLFAFASPTTDPFRGEAKSFLFQEYDLLAHAEPVEAFQAGRGPGASPHPSAGAVEAHA